jgi:hypothetical protein
MARMSFPESGRDVSGQAAACPDCASPIAQHPPWPAHPSGLRVAPQLPTNGLGAIVGLAMIIGAVRTSTGRRR